MKNLIKYTLTVCVAASLLVITAFAELPDPQYAGLLIGYTWGKYEGKMPTKAELIKAEQDWVRGAHIPPEDVHKAMQNFGAGFLVGYYCAKQAKHGDDCR